MGLPQNDWFIRELPMKLDDLRIPIFQESAIFLILLTMGYYLGGTLPIVII